MKTFKIENNVKNLNWVNSNLDLRDFKVENNEIVITYFNEMQKSDILKALSSIIKTYAEQFKAKNEGKYVWFNGAMGLDTAIANDYITDTREEAVKDMAWRDEVSIEDVENNYDDWFYILPVDELEDDAINAYFENL